MYTTDNMAIARHLEDMGVDIVRGGFASWIRDDLGFNVSDEHLERVLARVQTIVANGRLTTVYDLTATIAAEISTGVHIDAFGGSAWALDE